MSNSDSSSSSKTSGGVGEPHILVFPYPAQGHMLAMLDLAHHLALRGLTLTILVTHLNLPLLSPLLSSHPPDKIQTLVLPFPRHSSIPAAVEHVSQIGNSANYPFIAALSSLSDPIAAWFAAHPSPPLAILSDFFLGWTAALAARLSVPNISFFSARPFLAALLDRLWRHCNSRAARSDGGGRGCEDAILSFPTIPGSPSFPRRHLPSVFRRYEHGDPDSEAVRAAILANRSSWAAVFNSVHALEGAYLGHLRNDLGYAGGRVLAVGPLSLLSEKSDPVVVEKNTDAFAWLDRWPVESVLFVCFGSQKLLKKEQTEALAAALERSKSRFVWVVRPGTPEEVENGYGSVPDDGFVDRVGGRGLVIKGWAPQARILNHGAVGGFLSHCGWNSVLEAVAAGVVILGWPMEADQFVNAKLMVEEMGAAVRVCEGEDTVPDPAELARSIDEAMSGGIAQRVKAKELREEAVRAVGSGGTSLRDLDALVEELGKLKR